MKYETNMKSIILSFIGLFFSLSLVAQHIRASEVPTKVLSYVEKSYPKISYIDWEFKAKYKVYEAEFRIGGLEYELNITPEGILQYSKEDIAIEKIPQSIAEYLKKEYKDYNIEEAEKEFVAEKYEYKIQVRGKNKEGYARHFHLHFDQQGNVLSEKKHDDNDGEKKHRH